MRQITLSCLMLLVGFASHGEAFAQYARERSDVRFALSGATIVLRRHYDINDDCTSGPIPRLRVVTPPKLGRLLTRVSTRNPIQSTNPQRSACNKVRVRTLEVRYRARPGQRGEDLVVYNLIRGGSRLWREEFVIHVE